MKKVELLHIVSDNGKNERMLVNFIDGDKKVCDYIPISVLSLGKLKHTFSNVRNHIKKEKGIQEVESYIKNKTSKESMTKKPIKERNNCESMNIKCLKCDLSMNRLSYTEDIKNRSITINFLECKHCGSTASVTYNEPEGFVEKVVWERKG